MKYKTHIDSLYCIIITCFFAMSFSLCVSVILIGGNIAYRIISITIMLLVAIVCYLFCERQYLFTDNYFEVKIGFIKKRYYYSEIQKCFITENNRLSYATSMKRICIKKNDGTIYISPENINEALLILINRRVHDL